MCKALSRFGRVVVVTANYRLGPFGFLAHRALSSEEGRSAGDYALLDQREAMRWVQRNIGAFGGDPGNVTIFGQSAGGGSGCMHLVSPGSAGLFHKAILQSAVCTSVSLPSLDDAEARADEVALALGCEGDDEAIRACLRAAPTEDVLTALPFKEHVLFGEGVSFRSESALHDMVYDIFDEARAERVLARYASDEAQAKTAERIFSEMWTCDARRIAQSQHAGGGTVYHYYFTQGIYDVFTHLGAVHGAELPFVFGTTILGMRILPAGYPLRRAMQAYWTSFAHEGRPTGGGSSWRAYDPLVDESLRFDLAPSHARRVRASACDFWDEVLEEPDGG